MVCLPPSGKPANRFTSNCAQVKGRFGPTYTSTSAGASGSFLCRETTAMKVGPTHSIFRERTPRRFAPSTLSRFALGVFVLGGEQIRFRLPNNSPRFSVT